jgi:DNA-binding response OmpR family regulator
MPSNKPLNILIVEDDVFLADLYKTKFALEGFKVTVAYDGEKGLEMAGKLAPDIILLDLVLCSAAEVLQAVKANSKTKGIPVIC